MTRRNLRYYEQVLLGERARVRRDIARCHADATNDFGRGDRESTTEAPLHVSDRATEVAGQELALQLASHEEAMLADVEAALRRLRETPRAFGTCARCGAAIPRARLEALPATTRCVGCAA